MVRAAQKSPLEMFSVKDQIVILTGGAGFLGRQYAKTFAEIGARVIIWDNHEERLGEVRTLLSPLKKNIRFELLDVTDEKAVQKGAQKVVKEFGRIDVLINNAALNPAVGSPEAEKQFAPYEDYPTEIWRKEVDVNLTGMQICLKAVAPVMMKQRKGAVVNVASELAIIAYDWRIYPVGRRKSPAYQATKAGVLGLTRAWASHLGEYGIRVNAVSWGGMQTAKHPEDFVKKYSYLNMLGRMGQIGEYTSTMLYLCSDASSFMTGQNVVVDGGKSAW